MTSPRAILRRVGKLLWRSAADREMEEEMRLHIAMESEELVREGMDTADARRTAAARFGGVERHKDYARDGWPLRWLANVVADVRYAVRSLLRAPSFTITATLALALGIGANAIVFGAMDSIAFRPLAAREPARLVAIFGAQGNSTLLNFSWSGLEQFWRDSSAFAAVAAVTEGPVGLSDNGDAESVWAAHTSDNYFSMLGVEPATGTFYRPGDLRAPVVVLSHALWKNRFAGDPRIAGQRIHVNGITVTVLGVAPASFTGTRLFTYEPSVWLPVGLHAQTIPGSTGLLTDAGAARFLLLGRMKPGVTIAQAQTASDGVAARIAETLSPENAGLRTRLVSNRTPINPWLASPELIGLIGRLSVLGVMLVLFIACADVANLLLARMTARSQEVAIRVSLGASRGRLVQQFLTESMVLAVLGALASIPLTLLGTEWISTHGPHLDYASSYRPIADTRVALYCAALALGSVLVFGLSPALQAARRDVSSRLRRTASRSSVWRPQLREFLVIAQVATSVLVLAASGLFLRSLRAAHAIDTGFAIDGAVSFTVDPQLTPMYDTARTRQLYARVHDGLARISGVSGIARASALPLDGSSSSRRVFAEGTITTLDRAPVAEYIVVTPRYFDVIGTPLVEGREFATADVDAATDLVIVNSVLARTFWPGQSAIGKRIRLDSPAGVPAVVIGVARASRYRSLGESPRPAFWRDLDRAPRSRTTVVVRGIGANAAATNAVRAAMREIDPTLPLTGLSSLRDHVSLSFTAVESGALGALVCGVLALILATSGIYGVVSYGASQRRQEIGIRIALGARRAAVVRLVVGRALVMTLAGVAVGVVIVAAVPMGLDSILLGVSPHDPLVLIATAGFFLAVAGVAAMVPARRAAKLDPMRALRLTVILAMSLAGGRLGAQGEDALNKGRAAYLNRESDDAIQWFEKAVAAMPSSAAAHLWLGRAYSQALPKAGFLRQPILASHARSQYDKAVELDPKDFDIREARATYYMYAPGIAGGGIDKARAEAEVARALNPYRGALLRAQIEDHDGKRAAAEAEYVALLRSHPDSAGAFNSLVGFYQTSKQFPAAWTLIDSRSAATPDDVWAIYQTGKNAALSGERLDKGEAALRKYLRDGRFPPGASEANAHHRLGMILELKSDAKGARAEYAEAFRLDPKLTEAKKGLDRVGGAP